MHILQALLLWFFISGFVLMGGAGVSAAFPS